MKVDADLLEEVKEWMQKQKHAFARKSDTLLLAVESPILFSVKTYWYLHTHTQDLQVATVG